MSSIGFGVCSINNQFSLGTQIAIAATAAPLKIPTTRHHDKKLREWLRTQEYRSDIIGRAVHEAPRDRGKRLALQGDVPGC